MNPPSPAGVAVNEENTHARRPRRQAAANPSALAESGAAHLSGREAHAEEEYGPGERAGRTAIAALKHRFEKVGDHWEPKKHPGPSDPRAKHTTAEKRRGEGETFGGVDEEGHTRQELMDRAASLNIRGRSRMSKIELARAIGKKQG